MFNSELLHQFCKTGTAGKRANHPASPFRTYANTPPTAKRPPVFRTKGRSADQSIGLKLNAAPSLIPDGQREVMVFVRV